jgi:hydroxymethylpyrimidine pyrophosphatase-like HAD family hydrolase
LYNGALVVEHGTNGVVLHETIPFGAVQQIADLCGSWDVRVFAYCFDDPIAANLAGRAIEQVFGYGPNLPAQEFNGIPVNSWEEFPASSTLCTALLVDVSRLADSTFLRARLGQVHDTTCTSSGSRFVEIRPVGVNKGKALRAVATHLGIDLQEILAVGDNDNDVEMLETAGIGVSVCGASAAALAASHYVCRHGTAEGAVEIMRLVKHAKRFFVRPSLKREPR